MIGAGWGALVPAHTGASMQRRGRRRTFSPFLRPGSPASCGARAGRRRRATRAQTPSKVPRRVSVLACRAQGLGRNLGRKQQPRAGVRASKRASSATAGGGVHSAQSKPCVVSAQRQRPPASSNAAGGGGGGGTTCCGGAAGSARPAAAAAVAAATASCAAPCVGGIHCGSGSAGSQGGRRCGGAGSAGRAAASAPGGPEAHSTENISSSKEASSSGGRGSPTRTGDGAPNSGGGVARMPGARLRRRAVREEHACAATAGAPNQRGAGAARGGGGARIDAGGVSRAAELAVRRSFGKKCAAFPARCGRSRAAARTAAACPCPNAVLCARGGPRRGVLDGLAGRGSCFPAAQSAGRSGGARRRGVRLVPGAAPGSLGWRAARRALTLRRRSERTQSLVRTGEGCKGRASRYPGHGGAGLRRARAPACTVAPPAGVLPRTRLGRGAACASRRAHPERLTRPWAAAARCPCAATAGRRPTAVRATRTRTKSRMSTTATPWHSSTERSPRGCVASCVRAPWRRAKVP